MIRVELPAHLRTLVNVARKCSSRCSLPSRSGRSSTPSRPGFPCCRARFAITSRSGVGRSSASMRAKRICRTKSPTPCFQTTSQVAVSRFSSLDRWPVDRRFVVTLRPSVVVRPFLVATLVVFGGCGRQANPAPVTTGPAAPPALRLPGDVVPDHYALVVTPDLARATFAGNETIDLRVLKATPTIVVNSAEIAIAHVTVAAGGETQTATVALDPSTETASFTVAHPLAAGPARLSIVVQRRAERPTPRTLPEQGQRAPVCRDAARGDRRAPHVPVVRRARVQGDLRRHGR